VTPFALADRLIDIPTGTKVHKNTLKLDGRWLQNRTDQVRYALGIPILDAFDAFLLMDRPLQKGSDRVSLDFSYNAVVPIVDLSPGISVGVTDLFNNTRGNRSYYLAITNKIGLDGTYNMDTPAEVTYGIGTGGLHGLFFGSKLPFSDRVSILSEWDTTRLTGGLELKPHPDLSLRWLFRQQETVIQVQWTMRF